jgi:hypothetical protein
MRDSRSAPPGGAGLYQSGSLRVYRVCGQICGPSARRPITLSFLIFRGERGTKPLAATLSWFTPFTHPSFYHWPAGAEYPVEGQLAGAAGAIALLQLRNGALAACSVLRAAWWCCAASLAEADPAIKALPRSR